jgi:hypothetical protein
MKRNVNSKALKYLQSAFELDSTDSRCIEGLLLARFQNAKEAFAASLNEKGRTHFQEAILIVSKASQSSSNWIRSLALIHARWAACELTSGSIKEFEIQNKKLSSISNPFHSLLEVRFFLMLYAFCIAQSKEKKEKRKSRSKGSSAQGDNQEDKKKHGIPELTFLTAELKNEIKDLNSIASVIPLFSALQAVEQEHSGVTLGLEFEELIACSQKILKSKKGMITRNQSIELYNILKNEPKTRKKMEFTKNLIQLELNKNPQDIRFLLYQYEIEKNQPFFVPNEKIRHKLLYYLDLARAQSDSLAVHEIEGYLRETEIFIQVKKMFDFNPFEEIFPSASPNTFPNRDQDIEENKDPFDFDDFPFPHQNRENDL